MYNLVYFSFLLDYFNNNNIIIKVGAVVIVIAITIQLAYFFFRGLRALT